MSEDNFILFCLRNEIPHFRSCLNVILDIADHSMDPKTEASLDQHVMDLYGLIHARYILTKRGMDRMVSVVSSSYCKAMLCCLPRVLWYCSQIVFFPFFILTHHNESPELMQSGEEDTVVVVETRSYFLSFPLFPSLFSSFQLRKYRIGEFGVCPLNECNGQPVLPVGLKDTLRYHEVMIYCPRCGLIFHPAQKQLNFRDQCLKQTSPLRIVKHLVKRHINPLS